MKNKISHTVETDPKSNNRKILERA